MTLVVLSVVVIGLFIAVLAVYLLVTGVLLNRVADNLDDCLQSVKTIDRQAAPIGPGVVRLNKTGGELVDALALLYGGAEQLLAAKSGASTAAPASADAAPAGVGVGYMDLPEMAPPRSVAVIPGPAAAPVGVGYMDAPGAPAAAPAAAPAGVGYLDV